MRPFLLGVARDGSAMRRLCLAASLLGAALVGVSVASLQAQNPARGRDPNTADTNAIGMIGGTLTDAGDGQPMPYATVMLVGTDRESFADAQGHFRFTRLPFDTYNLRARQIGYAPVDTTIVLAGNEPAVDVTLRMQRVAVRLPAVAVLGSRAPGCVAPGVPDSAVDPALAGIFTQVRENADRFRMLLEAYPFRYRRLETVVLRSDPGGGQHAVSRYDGLRIAGSAPVPGRPCGIRRQGLAWPPRAPHVSPFVSGSRGLHVSQNALLPLWWDRVSRADAHRPWAPH